MTEQKMVDYLLDYWRHQCKSMGRRFNWWQIESGGTGVGVPDVLLFLDDRCFWLEFKMDRRNVEIQGGQIAAHKELLRSRQQAFFVLVNEKSMTLRAADVSGCATGAELVRKLRQARSVDVDEFILWLGV